MPIKPENKARYPKDWKAISKRIKDREGNKCKFCGVDNGVIGSRGLDGKFYSERYINGLNSDVGYAIFGDYGVKTVKIVLTVAHLDHQPENCKDENLAALCQKCHLNYDKDHHAKSRKETLAEKKGQLKLEL